MIPLFILLIKSIFISIGTNYPQLTEDLEVWDFLMFKKIFQTAYFVEFFFDTRIYKNVNYNL